MFSNEYIDYWGEVYIACHLSEHGVVFERFVEEPWRRLCELGLQSAPASIALGLRPLLPGQARVAQRLWKRWEEEEKKGPNRPALLSPKPLPPSGHLRPITSLLRSALSERVIPFPGTPRKSAKPRSKELS